MPTTVPPIDRPWPPMRTFRELEPGQKTWFVRYNDNSDHGEAETYFDNETAAIEYAAALEADPPKGNYFHPAPERLDIHIYAAERVA